MLAESEHITNEPYQNSKLVRPLVKWVGGKRQLMSDLKREMPSSFEAYYEPFIGGAALLMSLQPKKAFISDMNSELVNLYRVVKNNPEELISTLNMHRNEEEYFYEVRAQDRDPNVWINLTDIDKAARLIYLNRTCFNGLYRVNNAGEFNAPFGHYKKPRIVDPVTINAVSRFFQENDITILEGDFQASVTTAKSGDFVYFDPPYDPVSSSANFTGYAKGGFDRDEQKRLRDTAKHLADNGVNVLLSNSSTDFIREIYSDPVFRIVNVKARRAVNSVGADRGEVDEVLIRTYKK